MSESIEEKFEKFEKCEKFGRFGEVGEVWICGWYSPGNPKGGAFESGKILL